MDRVNQTATEKFSKAKTIGKADSETLEFSSFDMSSGAPVPLYLQQRKKKASSAVLLQKVPLPFYFYLLF